MNISSTPFIRNDYWPDYNDINELNQRINEAENETALVNARLSNDIENVSANLNGYMSSQADTVTTNNIIVNSLNANYAVGGYANFANTNTDNAYVENLTVNKPVFDITLNTPHIENATSLGGNFYNTNLINPSFEEIGSMSLDSLTVNTANIKELFVNTQPEPVTSSAVLGYDSEGRVIPIHASYDVGFPEDANYLFTDHAGTAFAGVAATEVDASSNLITAYAVKNAIDGVTADVSDNLNIINDALNDVDSWMNNIENDVNNRFEDVANQFNDVNNSITDGFNDVNNSFNDVANELNEANNTINNLRNTIRVLSIDDANYYWSDSPINYQNMVGIEIVVSSASGTQISGKRYPVNMVFNTTTNKLEFYSYNFNARVTAEFTQFNEVASIAQILNSDVSYLFYNCQNCNFEGNIFNSEWDYNFCDPNGNFITNMAYTFSYCTNLNQNIQIPDSVTNMSRAFAGCTNLNQNILIPNSVTAIDGAFNNCTNLDQNILIPNSVTAMQSAFDGCTSLDQNILIPNSVTAIDSAFDGCTSLSQDIYIYSQNVTDMYRAFSQTHVSRVHIPTSVPKDTSNYMYNCLVNGNTGITFPAANIFNDLPVDIEQWPPL